ncbi:MAG: hypothetical protein LWX52_08830 [Deltaproteobacteria bacterium]|jgi:hypothetical protein|nr:hypothetical protein [Deltaproteobacteria bacterium]
MIIDQNFIRTLQKESLEEYCLLHNVSVEEFCLKKHEDNKGELNKFQNHQNIISELFVKHLNVLDSSSIDAVLDMDYDFSESYRRGGIKDIEAFFLKYKYSTFFIDSDLLKNSAKDFKVNINSDNWMISYIYKIPMIILYTPFIEAYVQRIPNDLPKIIVSNSLNNVFENGIIPLLINHIFTIEKEEDGLPRFYLLPNTVPPSDLASTGDMIIEMAKFYLGQNAFIDFSKTRKSEAYPIFGTPFSIGINLFTILHEYSHVIYSHFEKKSEIIDEAFADNLALNILIERTLTELKSYGLDSDRSTVAFFRIYSFTLLAPMVMMHFLTVTKILLNAESSPTHPHPNARQWYLQEILMIYFKNRPPLKEQLEKISGLINNVFDYIYQKLGSKDKGINEQDMISVSNISLPVQFMK